MRHAPNPVIPGLQAVVFDLDGTLIDSVPDIHLALNRTLAAAGRTPVDIESVKLMVGDGARSLVASGFAATGAALHGDPLEAHYETFLALYDGPDTVALTQLYPGVRETLEHLLRVGYRLGLCTNKPAGPTADVLERFDLARYFQAVVTPEHVVASKPDAAHLRAVLNMLGTAPAEAVMVGDNANDVAVARNAKVSVVAVSYGYPRMAPEALGADLLIDHMAELPDALRRLRRGP